MQGFPFIVLLSPNIIYVSSKKLSAIIMSMINQITQTTLNIPNKKNKKQLR
jgi:hypothetical protein